jgi:hypothetical protein
MFESNMAFIRTMSASVVNDHSRLPPRPRRHSYLAARSCNGDGFTFVVSPFLRISLEYCHSLNRTHNL